MSLTQRMSLTSACHLTQRLSLAATLAISLNGRHSERSEESPHLFLLVLLLIIPKS
jgi:hypothetical protein